MGKLLAFFGVLAQVFACDSIYVPPCEFGSGAEAIFVGTAIDGVMSPSGTFRLRVDEPLKGIPRGVKEIEVGPQLGCGIRGYEKGTQHLILVDQLVPDPGEFAFSSGEPVEIAGDSIAFFRRLAAEGHLTIIQGRVAENLDDRDVRNEIFSENRPGLPRVEITAYKDGRSYSASTDVRGWYSLDVPEPGTYQVTAKLAGHSTADPSYEVELDPDSCKELDLGLWTASHLTGHVVGADGKPAANMKVQITGSDPAPPVLVREAETDGTGKFELVNLPPGDYVIGVNIMGFNFPNFGYATRFYPGVSEQSAAKVVKISGAQNIEGLDFQIGKRRRTRRITVALEWPDGTPVINADVMCKGSRHYSRYVDLNGEATCQVLADADSEVEAHQLQWTNSTANVAPVATRPKFPVRAGTDDVRVRIVLDAINDLRGKDTPVNMAESNNRDEP